MPPEVTRGIVAGYRKKAPSYQFFLARVDGVDCAYGAGVLATALIAHAIAHVRHQGADQVLIGALATAEPKRLYVRLGFDPVCVTRQYIKQQSEGPNP